MVTAAAVATWAAAVLFPDFQAAIRAAAASASEGCRSAGSATVVVLAAVDVVVGATVVGLVVDAGVVAVVTDVLAACPLVVPQAESATAAKPPATAVWTSRRERRCHVSYGERDIPLIVSRPGPLVPRLPLPVQDA